ncbi:MAG: triple tyrosine motif-containing protein [Bacteroidota bacterium]
MPYPGGLRSVCVNLGLFVLALALYSTSTSAQSRLRLQSFTVDEGLSQNSVNGICQDAHGFIWLATGDGLSRYDGKEFVAYKSRFTDTSAATLHDGNINSRLIEDNRHRIWMGTDAGISYLDYKHTEFKVVLDRQFVGSSVLLGIRDNVLWAVVPRNGFYAIDLTTLKHTHYPFTDRWQTDPNRVFPLHNCFFDRKGIWLADWKGVLYFDLQTHKNTRPVTKDDVYAITALRNGKILINSRDGVYIYDTATRHEEFVSIKTPGGEVQWHTCAEDTITDNIFLGSWVNGYVCKLDAATRKYELMTFQNNRINCMFIDRSQNLWVGTEGSGAWKLDIKPPKFASYTALPQGDKNSSDFMVKSIYKDERGVIWLGTANKGIWQYNPATGAQKKVWGPAPSDKNTQAAAIIRDSRGNIVAAAGDNVLWLSAESGRVVRRLALPMQQSSSIEKPVIYALTEWKPDHYIAATNLGLYMITNCSSSATAVFPRAFHRNNFGSWTYGLFPQPDGTIYLGRRNGFAIAKVINDTTMQLLYEGFDRFVIRHFYNSTERQVLWMATEQGLLAYDQKTKEVKVFDEAAGLGNSLLYAILPEHDSSLWVSTNKGIANIRIHGRDIKTLTAEVVNYTARDGLQSNEFNTGAYYKSPDGMMIFGGVSGINWFYPQSIRQNPYAAQPAITSLYINDTLFAADSANFLSSISLPHRRNTISLALRALEYTEPGENMFAYKLDGLDNDWVYTTSDKVRYSNLAPGNYTLIVKARNNEGAWSAAPHSLSITIRPPYWQEWWFRLLVLACLSAAIYAAGRSVIRRRVRLKTTELEKQQALNMERLRISKDVHDDLGSGLSKISLMAELAQKQVMDNITLGNDIQHISSVSKDLIDNMRDLIWVLNPENTTLDNLVARLREYSADYLDGTHIQLSLSFPDVVPQMRIAREAQRNIFSTVKEAINNSLKHSGAGEMNISLALDNEVLSIAIIDNGKGMTQSRKSHGNGLGNMKYRIDAIGGGFSIISTESGGTTVAIEVPLANIKDNHKALT